MATCAKNISLFEFLIRILMQNENTQETGDPHVIIEVRCRVLNFMSTIRVYVLCRQ
jgi:hypothetical protein